MNPVQPPPVTRCRDDRTRRASRDTDRSRWMVRQRLRACFDGVGDAQFVRTAFCRIRDRACLRLAGAAGSAGPGRSLQFPGAGAPEDECHLLARISAIRKDPLDKGKHASRPTQQVEGAITILNISR